MPNPLSQPEKDLLEAAFDNDTDRVLKILRDNPNINVNVQDEDGYSALHFAASHGNMLLCSQLINCKANVNPKDIDNILPIHLAANGGHNAIVKFLHDNGATIGMVDQQYSCLKIATFNGNVELMTYLLKERADPNEQDREGNTACHDVAMGISEGKTELYHLGLLVIAGAQNLSNNEGKTPADIAGSMADAGFIKVISDFMHHGKRFEKFVLNTQDDPYVQDLLGAFQDSIEEL